MMRTREMRTHVPWMCSRYNSINATQATSKQRNATNAQLNATIFIYWSVPTSLDILLDIV